MTVARPAMPVAAVPCPFTQQKGNGLLRSGRSHTTVWRNTSEGLSAAGQVLEALHDLQGAHG